MKGKTEIILRDVKTGEVQVFKDENLITTAIDKIINIEVAKNHAPNTYILPIATNALGGIMLFDGELTEDAGNIHFPSEAHLVGYANQSVNTSDKYRGSYNAAESGKTMTGFVSVWDFGTSQANGTIKSVARTSNHAGGCPLYNFLGPNAESTQAGCPTTDQYWYPIRYDGEYVYMLKGNSTTHVMRLARAKIPMLQMGVADYSDVARNYEVIASWYTEVFNLTVTYKPNDREYFVQIFADDPRMYEDGHDGYIYCMFGRYTPATNYETDYTYNINYFTINYGDGNYDKSETIRLNCGAGDYAYTASYTGGKVRYYSRLLGHVHKGVFYKVDGTRKILHIIPLNNVAAYRSVRILSDQTSDYIDHLNYTASPNGCIFFQIYHYTSNSYEFLDGILYPDGTFIVTEVSYTGAGHSARHNSSSLYNGYNWTQDDDLTVWGYYADTRITRNWIANYLGTVNNLAAPIVKTAAQTMKIIYTLTDIDEEDGEGEEGGG